MGISSTIPGIAQHSHASDVPVQVRSGRFRSRVASDFPEVTGREVDWKFTPVRALTTLISGELVAGLQTEITTEGNATLSEIPATDPRVTSAALPEDRASANALSALSTATLLEIASGHSGVTKLSRVGAGDAALASHTVIEVAPNARGTIVLDSSGDVRLAENVELLIGQDADVTVVSIQRWDAESSHLASHFARISKGAHLKHIVVSLGGGIVRVNPTLHLAEEGASTTALGLYFASSGQHLEQQVFVHHEAAHTKSRVTYKGALDGEGARSVWIGDVLIGPDATGTDSYEQNRNLVLSDGTRADSIPNLEIETGDIVGAGHASATGRFDEEQLFYLESRGIPEVEARKLVVHGFLNEVVQHIGVDDIEQLVSDMLSERLEASE